MRWIAIFVGIVGLLGLFAGGCGGGGTGLTPYGMGLKFDDENPSFVVAGRNVDLLVTATATTPQEANQTVHITVAGGTLQATEGAFDQKLSDQGVRTYFTIPALVQASEVAGTKLNLIIARGVAGAPAGTTIQDEITVTVSNVAVIPTLVPNAVSGPAGTSVSSVIHFSAPSTLSGTLTAAALVSNGSVSPGSVTIASGVVPTVTATYLIPASATAGSNINVPFAFETSIGHGFVMLPVVVTAQSASDFAVALDPGTATLTPGDSNGNITVGITPQGGFTGDVTVTVTFPSTSLSITPPTTNPFTIHVASSAQAYGQFRIHWNNQLGTPQGDAVVTCTGGGKTHSQNLHLIAS